MDTSPYSGTWYGRYVYGKGYGKMEGYSATFIMELDVEQNRLRGTCMDDPKAVPFETPATLEGVIENNRIAFVKKYPCKWSRDTTGKIVLHHDEPSHETLYVGELKDGGITGKWKIKAYIKIFGIFKKNYPLQGTWTVQREPLNDK